MTSQRRQIIKVPSVLLSPSDGGRWYHRRVVTINMSSALWVFFNIISQILNQVAVRGLNFGSCVYVEEGDAPCWTEMLLLWIFSQTSGEFNTSQMFRKQQKETKENQICVFCLSVLLQWQLRASSRAGVKQHHTSGTFVVFNRNLITLTQIALFFFLQMDTQSAVDNLLVDIFLNTPNWLKQKENQ